MVQLKSIYVFVTSELKITVLFYTYFEWCQKYVSLKMFYVIVS